MVRMAHTRGNAGTCRACIKARSRETCGRQRSSLPALRTRPWIGPSPAVVARRGRQMAKQSMWAWAAVVVLYSAPAHCTDYWPLEVGNWWSYEHTWYTVVYPDSLGQEIWGNADGEVIAQTESWQITSPYGPVYLQTRRSVDAYCLEVLGSEQVGERVFYRLSNGLMLAHDELGNIIEQVQAAGDSGSGERLLHDFATPCEDGRQFLTPVPRVIFWPGASSPPYPAARSRLASMSVKAGTFAEIVHFGVSFGLAEGYNVCFAVNVGPIRSSRGSDMVHEWQAYELLAANVGGRQIDRVTGVAPSTWGLVKLRNRQDQQTDRGRRSRAVNGW